MLPATSVSTNKFSRHGILGKQEFVEPLGLFLQSFFLERFRDSDSDSDSDPDSDSDSEEFLLEPVGLFLHFFFSWQSFFSEQSRDSDSDSEVSSLEHSQSILHGNLYLQSTSGRRQGSPRAKLGILGHL